jgi:hypothetical protein
LSFIQNALDKAQRLRGKIQKDLGGTAPKVPIGEDLEPRGSRLDGGGQEWEEVPMTESEETVSQEEEIFSQEAMGVKLLADVGRQIHRLTVIGLLFLTLNTLFLGISTLLMMQTFKDRAILLQIAQEMLPAKPSGEVAASGAEKTSQTGMAVAKNPAPQFQSSIPLHKPPGAPSSVTGGLKETPPQSTPSPPKVTTPTPSLPTYIVNIDYLALRDGPTKAAPKIATLKLNDEVELLGTSGRWVRVRDVRRNIIGWSYMRYLKPSGG